MTGALATWVQRAKCALPRDILQIESLQTGRLEGYTMHTNVRWLRAALGGLAVIVSSCLFAAPGLAADPVMTAHYVDVGQGACTLLEFPCGAILIDTGGDSKERVDSLVTYLNAFFARRTDLQNTLASVIITHPHLDHARGLRAVIQNFTVKNYIDDGHTTGSGRANPIWLRKEVAAHRQDVKIRVVRQEEIDAQEPGVGLTDESIDPLRCANCDPVITVLSGGHDSNPGWTAKEFKNLNNHSVVVRVDFGKSSFLFSGDLEEAGIEQLLEEYQDSNLLDVDVYMVGHHGAANATTSDFLDAITPEIAVMGTGKWTDGKTPAKKFSTYAYGHPRANVVKLLTDNISGLRTPQKKAMIADGVKKFRETTIKKKIYATGWDGTIDIKATLEGQYVVTHGNN
jgi:competence protein ComEC